MACGILIQLFNGYTKLELDQYLYRLFVLQLPEYWMIAALALTIHSVVNHKYLGHFLVIVYYIAEIMAEAFGYNHRLYRFWGGLTEALRTGQLQNEARSGEMPFFQALYADPARLKGFLAAMTGLTLLAQLMSRIFSRTA